MAVAVVVVVVHSFAGGVGLPGGDFFLGNHGRTTVFPASWEVVHVGRANRNR